MSNIPLSAINKGRSFEDVLIEAQRIIPDVMAAAESNGLTGSDFISSTIACAAYRIYLLGVEDGMGGSANV